MLAAAEDPEKSVNKQGMKLIKDKAAASKGCLFRSPGGEPLTLPGTAAFARYVLGPPRERRSDRRRGSARAAKASRTGNAFSLAGAARRRR